MSEITLRQALGVLAKSSPFSVKTVTQRVTDIFDDLKNYLYVEQEIEKDFKKLLTALSSGEVIFLCGSSGDGKSEILVRSYNDYHTKFHFHLDATHSFSPHQSAIDALNQLFDKKLSDSKPLILGINIGMLANFAKEGAERHSELKNVIERFLETGFPSESGYHFLDFEKYPKFQFNYEKQSYSHFVHTLIKKLTKSDPDNIFHVLAERDYKAGRDHKLIANFRLLGRDSVQEVIITNLFKTRLIKDQFITTRALLDLLHHLLLGDGYIFDNLFCGVDNDLSLRLKEFDPALRHTQKLDQFVLRYELMLPDPALELFLISLAETGISIPREQEKIGGAASLIRLFYLLHNDSIGNNYHQQFIDDFTEELLEAFSRIWLLHNNYNGSNELKIELRQFYMTELISAIFKYANRNAPELEKGEWFLGQFGSVKLAAPITLKGDFSAIQHEHIGKSSHFCAFLKIDEQSLAPMNINLNLFELIYKLNRGYRPNKYDKNAIVLLDEIVGLITDLAQSSPNLKFYEGTRAYVASQDDGMIAISGGS